MNVSRLYNYGIGIHLIENPSIDHEFDTTPTEVRPINPKDNHISFQVKNNKLHNLEILICGSNHEKIIMYFQNTEYEWHNTSSYYYMLYN